MTIAIPPRTLGEFLTNVVSNVIPASINTTAPVERNSSSVFKLNHQESWCSTFFSKPLITASKSAIRLRSCLIRLLSLLRSWWCCLAKTVMCCTKEFA